MRSIFFPRYQRSFLRLGDVGSHPQFRHLRYPPQGYDFIERPLRWGEWLRAWPGCFKTTLASWRQIYSSGRAGGLSTLQILIFLWTRGLDRIVPAPKNAEASFLPTFPLTHANEKWFLEIEDVTTLFRPFLLNGRTREGKHRDLPCYGLIKDMLASESCLGILTHVKSTVESISKLFDDPEISRKSACIPVPYIPRFEIDEAELNALRASDGFQFFFNNSWHQDLSNFYLRGGISILEAFERAVGEKLPVRLVIRSRIPKELEKRFEKLLSSPQVRLLDQFLPEDLFIQILRSSHFFLLPAARIHVVSLLESQYFGAVPIVSDGWGIKDYVEAGRDGYVVQGVYDRVSWADVHSGELREDYSAMYQSPGLLTDNLYQTIKDACSNGKHGEMAERAHRKVREQFNIEQFNTEFADFLNARFASQPVSSH